MDHTSVMQRVYDLLNAGDVDGFGTLLADDFVEHEAVPGLEPTKDGVLTFFRMFREGFPDLQMHVEELLPSGDRVVARVRATGTHEGSFMDMPATGKSIDAPLIDIIRFNDDGLAIEHWGVFDAMTMMRQLGAVPV